jgi:hypothetical protein
MPQVIKKRALLFLIVTLPLLVLLSGCDGSGATLSAESRSPDGQWIARAYVLKTSGIGTGENATHVTLNWTTGSQAQTLILAFSDAQDQPDHLNLGMNWVTPTHLELTYKGYRPVDFFAIRCHGIDISLRDLSRSQTSEAKSFP